MRMPASQAALLVSRTGPVRRAWAEARELAFIWVHAVPRLWQVARFTGGVLALIALKGIRRTLGHSGTLQ
jgi:hypothetical protein